MDTDSPRLITPKQESFLSSLLKRVNSLNEEWFEPLKNGEANIKELSSQEASRYIDALLSASDQTKPSGGGNTNQQSQTRMISEKQIRFLTRLINNTEHFEADWFAKLKQDPDSIGSLTLKDASYYITSLNNNPQTLSETTVFESNTSNQKHEAKSDDADIAKRCAFITNLLRKHGLIQDEKIPLEPLLRRLSQNDVNTLINILKRIS